MATSTGLSPRIGLFKDEPSEAEKSAVALDRRKVTTLNLVNARELERLGYRSDDIQAIFQDRVLYGKGVVVNGDTINDIWKYVHRRLVKIHGTDPKKLIEESKKSVESAELKRDNYNTMIEQLAELIDRVEHNPEILPALLKHAAKLTMRPTSSKLVSELNDDELATRRQRKAKNQAAWRARRTAEATP